MSELNFKYLSVVGGAAPSSIIGDDTGRGCTEIGMRIPF